MNHWTRKDCSELWRGAVESRERRPLQRFSNLVRWRQVFSKKIHDRRSDSETWKWEAKQWRERPITNDICQVALVYGLYMRICLRWSSSQYNVLWMRTVLASKEVEVLVSWAPEWFAWRPYTNERIVQYLQTEETCRKQMTDNHEEPRRRQFCPGGRSRKVVKMKVQ